MEAITTPRGEHLVVLSEEEYEDLVDTRDGLAALAEIQAGRMETLSEAELEAYLAAPSPLAFWRKRRSLTQVELARAVGISQPFLAQIEAGRRQGDIGTYARLARRLGVRIEDLIPSDI